MTTFNIHKSINFKSACGGVTGTDLRTVKRYWECYPIELYACQWPCFKPLFSGNRGHKGKQHSKYPTIEFIKKPVPYMYMIQG